MPEEDLIELKFRLYDGSDIGPIRYSPNSTVEMLKERILSEWPKDKKIIPKVANDIKLINAGKFLENNKTVSQCRPASGELTGGGITMHVVVQPSSSKTKAGAKVQIQCRFKQSSASRRYRSTTAQATTDKYGVYKFDIPPVPGFKCRQGKEIKNSCRATLIGSSSSLCNHTGIQASTTQHAIKPKTTDNLCIFNFNALSYRPPNRDASYCGVQNRPLSSGLDSSLFFWPLFPPFGLPWLNWPPLPFTFPPLPLPFLFSSIPLPDPSSFPFSPPPWLRFLDPSSLPFPFSLFPPLFAPFTPAPSRSPPSQPWP